MKAEIRREEAPPGTFAEWVNLLPGWLYLQLYDGTLLPVEPGGRIQVLRADLARAPDIAGFFEGLELRGTLRQSDPTGA